MPLMKVVLLIRYSNKNFVLGRLSRIWPQKLTLKSENTLFLPAPPQIVLQDTNKSFQDVH